MKRLMFHVALLTLAVATISFAGLPGDIVLLMTFDEGKGDTTKDLSGNDNHGAVNGSAQWDNGKFGKGFVFDGKTNIAVENADPLKKLTHPMTVGAWVKADGLGGWRNIAEMDGPSGWKLGFNNTKPVWTTYFVKDFTGQSELPDGEWFHYAATWNGKEAIIYLNGEVDKGGPIAGGGNIDISKEPSLDIGWRRSSKSSYFKGMMDDLFVANTVKSQAEIKKIMGGFEDFLAVDHAGKISTTWGEIRSDLE